MIKHGVTLARLALASMVTAATAMPAEAQTNYTEAVITPLPGSVREISIGFDGSVFALSTTSNGTAPSGVKNYTIHRWNESRKDWDNIAGQAYKIAVAPDGVPWVVTAQGGIWRWSSKSTPNFVQLPGGASDIGIGADGSVYVVGGTPANGNFNNKIYKWTGSSWSETTGAGMIVAVDKWGVAWALTAEGQMYSLSPSVLGPPAFGGGFKAMHFAIGADGKGGVAVAWANPGDGNVYRWEGKSWTPLSRNAVRVAVAPDGGPWFVNAQGSVFRTEYRQAPAPVAPTGGSGTSLPTLQSSCLQPGGTQGACPPPVPQGEKFVTRPGCISGGPYDFDGQHLFFSTVEPGLANATQFASDPVVCIAYGSKAPVATVPLPPAQPSRRDYLSAGKSSDPCVNSIAQCPPDNQRRVWLVTRSGRVFREEDKEPSTAAPLGLLAVPGGALAIKAGADYSIWAISNDTVPGGHSIYRWSGANWNRLPVNGVNAGVAHNGRIWVINDAGKLQRQDVVGTWVDIPLPAPAWDVYFDPASDHVPTAMVQRTQAPTATAQGKFVVFTFKSTGDFPPASAWVSSPVINADAVQMLTTGRVARTLAGVLGSSNF